MWKALLSLLAVLVLSACVAEPTDPSFIGARAFNSEEAAKTRVSLGLTYLKNGNFSQAKSNLDKALEFAPRNGQAHFGMAFYYQQVGEAALAEESYEKALNFSRNDPDVVNSYGAFLCQQGNYEKAKEYFLKAVNDRNYVSTAGTYENLAICSQSQGKNEEAIQFFISALNHQPMRAQSLYLLTNLYVQEQKWEDAKRTLFKYERNAQVSAETLYLQFQIAQGLGDTQTAVGYGEILKTMFPEHSNTALYLAQMGKFKPSATITRKPRIPVSSVEPLLSPQTTETVLTSPDSNSDRIETKTPAQPANEQLASQEINDEPVIIIIDTTKTELQTPGTAELSTTESPNVDIVEVTIPESQGIAPVETIDTVDLVSADANAINEQNSDVEMLESDGYEDVEAALAAEFESNSETDEVDEIQEPTDESDSAYHLVTPKENLYRISLKYNVKMKTLLEWNNLADASAIKIGTKLRVRDPNNNE